MLLHALHAGDDREAARRARRRADRRSTRRAFGDGPGGGHDRRRCRRCSRSRSDRLPHPPRPRAGARGRAGGRRARGGREPHPHDRHGLRGAAAPRSPPPSASRRSTPPSAATPTAPTGFDDAAAAELRRARAHPRCLAIGETGLDYYRDRAPRADQERAFPAQIELARETGKPLVIHTRAADDDTSPRSTTRAQGIEVVMHCFSMPDRLDECLERGWWISFAGNVTYPQRASWRAAAERVPLDRLLVETDAPYLTPAGASASTATRPPFVVHTARFVAERRGDRLRRARGRRSRRTPRGCSAGERAPGAAEPAPPEGVRHPPEPRAGPELPDRLEPARRDRARRGARPRRRRARGRRRPRRAVRVPRRARAAHVHVVEVDRRARAGAARRRRPARQRRRCTSPTRSSSTSRRSTRRRRRWSRTCPTASPRR